MRRGRSRPPAATSLPLTSPARGGRADSRSGSPCLATFEEASIPHSTDRAPGAHLWRPAKYVVTMTVRRAGLTLVGWLMATSALRAGRGKRSTFLSQFGHPRAIRRPAVEVVADRGVPFLVRVRVRAGGSRHANSKLATYPWNNRSLFLMNSKQRSLGPKVVAAGLVAGLLAGWSSGCSRPSSANVNLKTAREAFAKRRADYGETPGSQSRVKAKAQTQHR